MYHGVSQYHSVSKHNPLAFKYAFFSGSLVKIHHLLVGTLIPKVRFACLRVALGCNFCTGPIDFYELFIPIPFQSYTFYPQLLSVKLARISEVYGIFGCSNSF